MRVNIKLTIYLFINYIHSEGITMTTPYSSFAVANYFIKKANDEGRRDLSPMKLQKLIYFAHGWYLGFKEEPLIDELVQAWYYGPVIESLYHKTKQYGNDHLNNTLPAEEDILEDEDEDVMELLNAVWDNYGNEDAITLANATHIKNSPWDKIYNAPENKGLKGLVIDNKTIKEDFQNKMKMVDEED